LEKQVSTLKVAAMVEKEILNGIVLGLGLNNIKNSPGLSSRAIYCTIFGTLKNTITYNEL
jgi:hypothetical protein